MWKFSHVICVCMFVCVWYKIENKTSTHHKHAYIRKKIFMQIYIISEMFKMRLKKRKKKRDFIKFWNNLFFIFSQMDSIRRASRNGARQMVKAARGNNSTNRSRRTQESYSRWHNDARCHAYRYQRDSRYLKNFLCKKSTIGKKVSCKILSKLSNLEGLFFFLEPKYFYLTQNTKILL